MSKKWFLAAILAAATPAAAHDWYPMECCHAMDCAPVEKVEMLPGPPMASMLSTPAQANSLGAMLVTTRHGSVVVPDVLRSGDHVVSARNLLGAVFYDVGQSYLAGRFHPVVHGVGVGLRLDVALFAFLERATLRLDLAQPIGTGRGPVVWFGLNQVF